MDQFEELNISSEPAQPVKTPSMFQVNFNKMISDMRFVGLFTIIYGVIACLTIIGAIFGVPIIFIGLHIREAADQFSIFKMTNNTASLKQGFELQGKYFRLIKILIVIGLVLTVLYIIFIIYLFTVGFGALLGGSGFKSV